MAQFKIAQLETGGKDAFGLEVECIYAFNDPTYAIYRTGCRVTVQFADTQPLADHQRAMLTPLASLRGQIGGLIDGWHDGSASRAMQDKAKGFDRRVAAALDTALQGDLTRAGSLLEEVRDAIVADRRSWARFQYLLVASGSAAAGLALVGLTALGLTWFGNGYGASASILNGVIGGTLGAFFSIATGLQKRTVLTDLQWRDNMCDAILRVVIGLMAAGVLVCFMESGIVQGLSFGGEASTAGAPWFKFLAGFIAGFSERLVPDLLAKAAVVGTSGAETGGKDAAAQAAAAPSERALAAAAAVVNASAAQASAPAEPTHPDEGDDVCLCDAPPVEGEDVTSDKDLPVATGGVSASVTAGAPNIAQPDDTPGGGPGDEPEQEQAAE